MKTRILFAVVPLLVCCQINVQGQTFVQKGVDLDGEANQDWSGCSVSMPDANTVAIGARLNDGNGSNSGHVRVYKWDGNAWIQRGNDIDGEYPNDLSGWSVYMPDTITVAIGAPYNAGANTGQVRIYKWRGNAWVQKGLDINGEAGNDYASWSISMPDTNTFAIGARGNTNPNGSDAGHVRIYKWNGLAWVQKGADIDGEAAYDESGWSVSMPDSNTVAIGARFNDGNGNNAGHVRIYKWNGTSWAQRGNDIDGEAAGDNSGHSVFMPDTNTVAIGAYLNGGNGTKSGHVRIYAWRNNAWTQRGADIDGEAAEDESGFSVCMPDTNTVGIGAHFNNSAAGHEGHVRVYKWRGTGWVQKGFDIDGEGGSDQSGEAISMPDSNTVAIGAPFNDGVGGNLMGHVRIYSYCIATSSSMNAQACDSFTVPSGDETYGSSGIYQDTIVNAKGCDSLLTINLTIIQSTTVSQSISACDSFMVPSGDETHLISGTYMDTIPNTAGCDSLLTLNVTVGYSTASSLTISACDSFTVPSGDETYANSGIYRDTIPNIAGCDSLITMNVTVTKVDTSLVITPPTITATNAGATYQWIYCDSISLPGENQQSLTPPVNGRYAVIITENGCTDTSSCITISNVGIIQTDFMSTVKLFPNPTTGNLLVDLGSRYHDVEMSIFNQLGEQMETRVIGTTSSFEMDIPGPAGIYFIELGAGQEQNVRIRIVKI